MRAHVRFAAEIRTVEDLLVRFLEGSVEANEVSERAARANLALDGPGRLLLLAPSDPSGGSSASRTEALRGVFDRVRSFDKGAAAVICRDQIVALAPYSPKREPRWQGFVTGALDEMRLAMGPDVVAVSSRVCEGLASYPKAFGDCERVLQLARRIGRTGHVSERDFGPFPVLMSALHPAEMREFVGGLVGEIAQHDLARRTSYIETLSCYLDNGCRIHASAAALGLHVTTLRYRLARMRELFDVRMDTPDERLALQLAIRFVGVLAPKPGSGPPAVRRKARVGTSAGE
jgi:purine catabolism regulator